MDDKSLSQEFSPAPVAQAGHPTQGSAAHRVPRGHIHHIDLTVRDPTASLAFYEAVLGFMGYKLAREAPDGFDFEARTAHGFVSVGLVRARPPGHDRPHDRYAPGLHHIAWHAQSRNDVDALHALLCTRGHEVLDAPAEYPEYGPGYYAVFFADPDGLKLEFVFNAGSSG